MTLYKLTQTSPLPNRPRPIVLIGAGGIVRDAHLPAYAKAGFPVAGIFDLDPAKARDLAARFAIPRVFASLPEAVADAPAEGVFDIAIPASGLLDALPHLPDGAAVLIQKPLGEDLAQARAIRDLCQGKRLRAAVNFQLRFAPPVLAARSLLEQEAIGTLHDLEVRVTVYTPWHLWTFLEKKSRVEILYHSVHYVDLLRAFCGEPRGVYAKTLKHPKAPRLAATRSTIILDYGDDLRATITANHGHEFGLRHQESYIKWEGSEGAIVARLGLLMNYPQGEPDQFEYCVRGESGAYEWHEAQLAGSWFPDAFIGTMASLMRYAERSTDELPTSVDDAFKTMAVVEAAYRSSAQGGCAVAAE